MERNPKNESEESYLPRGGRSDDFEDLSDSTVMDIATSPRTNPADRQNARAELEKRIKDGTYNGNFEPTKTMDDLLEHDFGIAKGQIYYPTEERKAWLKSDRSTPAPEGIQKESIADRLAREESLEHERRERERLSGKNALNTFANTKEIHSSEEEIIGEYGERFEKEAPKWLFVGVSESLKKGQTWVTKESLLQRGFFIREGEAIHEKIDPNDDFSEELIEKERNVKVGVAKEIISARGDGISDEEVINAKKKGSIYAIAVGANRDKSTGKVEYSFPANKRDDVLGFIKDSGLDPEKHAAGDSEHLYNASFVGFKNIIDAIKDDYKPDENGVIKNRSFNDGIEALDWYFDTFEYGEKIDEFLGRMETFEEKSDSKWGEVFEYYKQTRKEVSQYEKDIEGSEPPELQGVEEVNEEKLQSFLESIIQNEENYYTMEIFSRLNPNGGPINTNKKVEHGDSIPGRNKLSKIIEEFEHIKNEDPYANVYNAYTIRDGERKPYVVIRYGKNDNNVAIALPYADFSFDASYVWIGKSGDNREAWREVFCGNVSKSSVRKRSDVKAHTHRANYKKGRDAISNMWFNIYKDIDKRTKEANSAA